MRVKFKGYPTMDIIDFAERHDLTLVVVERPLALWKDAPWLRYSAQFEEVSIIKGPDLVKDPGNGVNRITAVQSYIIKIREVLVSVKHGDSKKSMVVPFLTMDMDRLCEEFQSQEEFQLTQGDEDEKAT